VGFGQPTPFADIKATFAVETVNASFSSAKSTLVDGLLLGGIELGWSRCLRGKNLYSHWAGLDFFHREDCSFRAKFKGLKRGFVGWYNGFA
jgi:hypothetical protein